MSATVIIPTTGNPLVVDAIKSVFAQTYSTSCYLVVDGEEYLDETQKLVSKFKNENLKICCLPKNVGGNGYYGHRVYAAFTHLIDTEYLMYLDQDNWIENDHVKSCINCIRINDLDWCYALRNIYDGDQFVCQDNCESLGMWPSIHGVHHIDTNSFFLKRDVAISNAANWHGKWGQDRIYFNQLRNNTRWGCTKLYTVNYRVNGNIGSVKKEFFINGNLIMEKLYKNNFPWSVIC